MTEVESMKETSIRATCKHCGYVWQYNGISFYAQCPRCLKRTKVRNL